MAGPVRADGSGSFCPNCGNSASADHEEYCIHCGQDLSALREVAEQNSSESTPSRSRERTTGRGRVGTGRQSDDIEQFRKRVRFLVSNGWDIEYDGHDEVVLGD